MDPSANHYPFSFSVSRERLITATSSMVVVGALTLGAFVGLEKVTDPVKALDTSCSKIEQTTLETSMSIGQLAIVSSYKTGEDWRALKDRITSLNPNLKDGVANKGESVFMPNCS